MDALNGLEVFFFFWWTGKYIKRSRSCTKIPKPFNSHWKWFVVYNTLVFSGPLILLFHWTKILWTNLHMFKIVDHIFLAFLHRWNTFRFQKIYWWLSLPYIYIYICGWVQVTPDVTLSNITPSNNLLLNSYFENLTIRLYILYVLTWMPIFIPIRCYLLFDQ